MALPVENNFTQTSENYYGSTFFSAGWGSVPRLNILYALHSISRSFELETPADTTLSGSPPDVVIVSVPSSAVASFFYHSVITHEGTFGSVPMTMISETVFDPNAALNVADQWLGESKISSISVSGADVLGQSRGTDLNINGVAFKAPIYIGLTAPSYNAPLHGLGLPDRVTNAWWASVWPTINISAISTIDLNAIADRSRQETEKTARRQIAFSLSKPSIQELGAAWAWCKAINNAIKPATSSVLDPFEDDRYRPQRDFLDSIPLAPSVADALQYVLPTKHAAWGGASRIVVIPEHLNFISETEARTRDAYMVPVPSMIRSQLYLWATGLFAAAQKELKSLYWISEWSSWYPATVKAGDAAMKEGHAPWKAEYRLSNSDGSCISASLPAKDAIRHFKVDSTVQNAPSIIGKELHSSEIHSYVVIPPASNLNPDVVQSTSDPRVWRNKPPVDDSPYGKLVYDKTLFRQKYGSSPAAFDLVDADGKTPSNGTKFYTSHAFYAIKNGIRVTFPIEWDTALVADREMTLLAINSSIAGVVEQFRDATSNVYDFDFETSFSTRDDIVEARSRSVENLYVWPLHAIYYNPGSFSQAALGGIWT